MEALNAGKILKKDLMRVWENNYLNKKLNKIVMKQKIKTANVIELSNTELQNINGGGDTWSWLGRIVGRTIKIIGEVGWALSGNPTELTDPS